MAYGVVVTSMTVGRRYGPAMAGLLAIGLLVTSSTRLIDED